MIKKIAIIYLAFLFISCSPYKKIRITMSEMQTKAWINKTEEEVVSKLGSFKTKEKLETGYKIFFDYSTYRMPTYNASLNNYRPTAQNQNIVDNKEKLIAANSSFNNNTPRASSFNSVKELVDFRTLEFFFDKKSAVIYVFANGYPDSIRYELRKKL
jgi:hypothetical protein